MSSTSTRPPHISALSLPALAFILATAACARGPANATDTPAQEAAPPASAELGIPGRLNQFPSLAASGSYAAVAWASADSAGVTDVYVAMSDDAGASFGDPVRVNHTPGDARANGEQPPRVAAIAQPSGPPRIVVFWLARRASGSVLLTSRSNDGGRTFTDATLVPGTDTAGNRGWHTLDVGPDGSVHLAWLDHRRMAANTDAGTTHRHHAHAAGAAPAAASADTVDTVAMAQRSDLYFAAGLDDTTPRALTAGVCYCCKTAMVHGSDGTIHVAWRHVYPGNMRDIAFTTSRNGGRTFSDPVRVSEDLWSIAGCPDDGPSMAVDAAGRVHVVWPTVVTFRDGSTQKTLFHAMTTDGRTFTPRVAIPHDGAAHHPQVTSTGPGAIVVAWDGHIGDAPHVFRARGTLDAGGAMQFTKLNDAPIPGRYPTVAATGARTITAWIAGQSPASSIRVAVDEVR